MTARRPEELRDAVDSLDRIEEIELDRKKLATGDFRIVSADRGSLINDLASDALHRIAIAIDAELFAIVEAHLEGLNELGVDLTDIAVVAPLK